MIGQSLSNTNEKCYRAFSNKFCKLNMARLVESFASGHCISFFNNFLILKNNIIFVFWKPNSFKLDWICKKVIIFMILLLDSIYGVYFYINI
jgi:hypothetical protein